MASSFAQVADSCCLLPHSGDAECLRDEITLLAYKATLAGVEVQHELYIDQVHVFQSFPFLESCGVAFKSIAKYVKGLQETDPSLLPQGSENPVPHIQTTLQDRSGPLYTPVDEDTVASEMALGETKLVKSDGTEVDIDEAKDDEVEGVNEKAEQILQETIDKEEAEEEEEEQRDSLSPLAKSSALLPLVDDEGEGRNEQGEPSISITHASEEDISGLPRAASPQKPFMRRALSGFARARPESPQLVRRTSGSSFFSFSAVRPTTSITNALGAQDHQLPPSSPSTGAAHLPSSPSWPPHTAARGHRPTISHHLARSPVVPTTRARSSSHSDMINLVNGYSQGGAAIRTVVYSPGPVKATTVVQNDTDLHDAPLDLNVDAQTTHTHAHGDIKPGGLGLHTQG